MYSAEYRRHEKGPLLVIAFYVLILLDIFTFSEQRIEGYSNVLPIIVPYITVSNAVSLPFWMLVIVVLFTIGVMSNKGKINLDAAGIFFVVRILLGIIQIVWLYASGHGESIRWGNYYLYVIELLMYFCSLCLFSYDNFEKYIRMIKVISLIIAVETIWQCVRGVLPQVSYTSTWYKACMNIPVGSSNTLGAMITPCFVATLFETKKIDVKRFGYLLVLGVAIFLTKSRFSMAVSLAGFAVYLFSDFKEMTSNQRKIRIVGIIVTIALLLYFIIEHYSDIGIVLYGFSDYVTEGGVINRLSSGRVSTIGRYIEYIIMHPIVGNGPNYEVSRTHNIIIDLLYQSGIIGISLFAYAITKLLRKSKLQSKDQPHIKFMHYYILFSIIGSLGEISFFTGRVSDVLFIPALAFTSICTSKVQKID